MTMINT